MERIFSYQDNEPALYLVPTPIGNIKDITLRSIDILKSVDCIFSEDTRVTKILLKNYNISTKLISFHEYNEEKVKNDVLNLLKNNKSVAIVSDRGTPLINDPGYKCVKHIIASKQKVISLPGASAFLPALLVSGLEAQPFLFYGFLNSKDSKRKQELDELKQHKETMIFYEAPHRLKDTLNIMLEIFGNRKISISREITKVYEEVIRGNIKEIIDNLTEIKGEFVIVVEGNKEKLSFDNLSIIEHVNLYIKEGQNVMNAIKKTAKDRNLTKNEVYKEYHRR